MKKTRGICYPPLFWCSISNIHNWMFLHVLLAGVWIFMSLQGLVGCLPFVGYNFLGFGSPQPPPEVAPRSRFSRYTDKSEVCFLSKTPQKKYKEPGGNLRPRSSRCYRPVVFRVGSDVTWWSLGCLKLLSPPAVTTNFPKVSENWSPKLLVGKTKGNSIWRGRILRNADGKIWKKQQGTVLGKQRIMDP